MSDCNCGFGARIPGFGTPGATFVPKVTETQDAVQLGWENNRGLANPAPVSIPRGKDGLSAYEVAKANGFEGTEQEWLESLEGPVGPVGPQGKVGPIGPTGNTGDPGKSAYEYAKDGGYTGTEEEFAAKLAAESVPAPVAAQPGQLLVVEEVDAAGKITKVTPMDRTHWKEEVPAIFDGDLTGRELISFMDGVRIFKMSDSVLPSEELIGRTMTEVVEVEEGVYEDVQFVLSAEENITDLTSEGMPVVVAAGEGIVVSVLEDTSFEGVPLTKGIYYSAIEVEGRVAFYTKSLSGLTMTRYHKIPEEYINTKPTQFVKVAKLDDGTYSVDVTVSRLKFWLENGYHIVAEYTINKDDGSHKYYVPLSHFNYGNESLPGVIFANFYGVSYMTVNEGCTFIWIIMSNMNSESGAELYAVVREKEQPWVE